MGNFMIIRCEYELHDHKKVHIFIQRLSQWSSSFSKSPTNTRLCTRQPSFSLCSPPPLWGGSGCLTGWLSCLYLMGFCLRPDSESIWQVPLSTEFLPTPGLWSLCKCTVYSIWLSFLFLSHDALFLLWVWFIEQNTGNPVWLKTWWDKQQNWSQVHTAVSVIKRETLTVY